MNQPSVLVVDDEPDNFDVIEALLNGCGYNLHYAVDGQHAIDSLSIFKPDLLLLDVMMPNVDGLEVCKWMSKDPIWKFIPIIIVTALNSKEDLARCLEAGADDFVSKPVNRIELRARVNSMLRIKRQHDLLQASIGEIQQAKAAAELATQAKADFLAMMSHEIRTPIHSVLGMNQLLATTQLTSQQQKYVHTTQISGEMLLCAIDDILDFSKIESGKLDLEQRPLDLQCLLQDITNLVLPKATEKNLHLTYTLAADVPQYIVSDLTRLRQILLNLVNNAVKFTSTGSVTISCQTHQIGSERQGLQFSIIDTGIGIAAADIARLFQPFTQASSSTTREYGGTGLGLTICHRLVELLQGKIWIESELDRGTTFHFTIVAAESPRLDEPVVVPTNQQPVGAILPRQVLIAEDNQIAQEVVVAMFERLGYTPDIVQNGLEVIAAVRAKSYDLVFLDLHMPKLDGLETAKYLVKEWANLGATAERPKLVAMTASAMQGDRESCMAAGMDDYISKPISIEALERTIGKWNQATGGLVETPLAQPQLVTTTLDRTAIERLREASPTLPQRLIHIFLNEEAPQLLDRLAKAIHHGDLVVLCETAHNLRGTASSLGAQKLAQLCQQVEANSDRGDLDDLDLQLDLIITEYHLVRQQLLQLMAAEPELR